MFRLGSSILIWPGWTTLSYAERLLSFRTAQHVEHFKVPKISRNASSNVQVGFAVASKDAKRSNNSVTCAGASGRADGGNRDPHPSDRGLGCLFSPR